MGCSPHKKFLESRANIDVGVAVAQFAFRAVAIEDQRQLPRQHRRNFTEVSRERLRGQIQRVPMWPAAQSAGSRASRKRAATRFQSCFAWSSAMNASALCVCLGGVISGRPRGEI